MANICLSYTYPILIFTYCFISKSFRPEKPIEDNIGCIENVSSDPSPSSSENQDSETDCNNNPTQDLSESFSRLSTSGVNDFESEPTESPMSLKTIPLQQYEDLMQFQSQIDELKNAVKRMEDIIVEKNTEIAELKKAHEREKKTLEGFDNLSPVSAEGIFS